MRYLCKYVILLGLLLYTTKMNAQIFTDPAAALDTAQARAKPVLLVFQGSDWCVPCIRLEQKVLSRRAFGSFAEQYLVVLKADFPQNKKIPPLLAGQYDALAERYNPEGRFPKLLLLDREGNVRTLFPTDYTTPEALIADLEQALKQYHADL